MELKTKGQKSTRLGLSPDKKPNWSITIQRSSFVVQTGIIVKTGQ